PRRKVLSGFGRAMTAMLLASMGMRRAWGQASPPPTCGIRTVTVWLNAFIPDHLPGYTFQLPANSPFAGMTAIPGPAPACFLTDERTFDTGVAARSRMHSIV